MLQKINNIYYVRFFIPKDKQELFCAKELLKSLKTTNKNEAKLLHNTFVAKVQTIIFYARSKMISDDKLNEMVLDFKKRGIETINEEYISHPSPKETQRHQNWEYPKLIRKYKLCIYNNDYTIIEKDIKELLNKFNIS